MKVFTKLLLAVFFSLTGYNQLAAQPTITSFTPTSGAVGTLITITGTNLSSPTAITIGGLAAIPISNDGTTLVAMVMPGATTGVISVATASGTANGAGNITVTAAPAPNNQQGSKLVGTGAVGGAIQGYSVSISADGSTAIVGGYSDNNYTGAAWIYTRSGSSWSQQGGKLVGTVATVGSQQGYSVSISADGNTAIVGGNGNNSSTGAAWVYTRSGSTWSQQGSKLVGTAVSGSAQGTSISLSADGNTAIVGGSGDNNNKGAVWIYIRSGSTWSQQGSKLVGTGAVGNARQGYSVSLSADGTTAMVGGYGDNSSAGAAWVYTRSGSTWSQQGGKLVGTGAVGSAQQGTSVSLSADGNTAILGGFVDNSYTGAAWVYTRSGSTWSQQGGKLVGTGAVGNAQQGYSVSLTADGNTAIVGGNGDNSNAGAAWIYTRSGSTWSQQGSKLEGTGAVGTAFQGQSVSLSADGNTAIVGGYGDNSYAGATWIYNYMAASNNADLSALTTTADTITPTFAASTTAYTASVAYATSTVTVTPTVADATATVQVRVNSGSYATVTSGAASAALSLNIGSNPIDVKVTAQDGTTIKTYTLTVTRVASTNADLSALTVAAGTFVQTLSPSFAAATTAYTVASVPYMVSSVTVTPTVADATAIIEIQVNGGGYATVASGSTSDISLNVGANPIDVKVTAQDGTTIKTYTITVTRDAASTNTDLRALTITSGSITPTFLSTRTAYTSNALYTSAFVRVTATKFDPLAYKIEVRVNSGTYVYTESGLQSTALALNVGTNTIDTKVTAEDGVTFKVYTITVTRAAASTNANLQNLTTTAGTITPTFASATTDYTASVANATSSVTVTPIQSNPYATIQVRVNSGSYAAVTMGAASAALSLNVGSNPIDVKVTAQDGTTIKTYTITVTRATNTNADLSALTTTAGTITPTFASATTDYTASVANATSSVTVTPTLADANATVQVRVNSGSYATVTSGAASSALSLNVGSNPIDVKVTALDGTTIKTYTITVTRAMASPGNALNFDGVDDNVSIPSVAGFGVSKVTIETWVYWTPTNNTDIQFICSKGLGGGSEVLEIHTGGTANALRFLPTPNVYIDVFNALPVGKWTHIAYVHDPSTSYLKVYINGVEKPYTVTLGSIGNALTTSSNAFTIGKRSSNSYYFKGSIDEFRLWNVVRSQAEIQANMFSTINPSTTGLFAYYNFDNGVAGGTNTGLTTLADQTSNGNNGTLNNFTLSGATSNWITSTAWNTWTGTTSNAFATATNWSLGTVPTTSDNIVIPTGASNLPVAVTTAQGFYNAQVQTSASLTNTSTLSITGNLINSGTITSTAGTVAYTGTEAQSIAASTFASNTIQGLTINNAAGVTLGGALTVTDVLTPTAGTFTTGGLLTIAPGGAIIGTYANMSGAVTLQQSVVGQRGYRIFANPFTTTTDIATIASNNAIAIATTAYAVSSLTDARTFSNSTNLWTNVTAATLAANSPYALFIRGLNSEVNGATYTGGPSAFTYNVSGTLNGASTSITPSSTANFMVVGNPYAAPVNTQALTNGSKPYYTYQIAVTGTPRVKAGSWVAAGSSSNTTNTIPVLGVLAYQPSSTSLYNITTSDINTTGTLQTGLFGVNDTKQLELLVEQAGYFQDKLFVRLDAAATSNATDQADLTKFYNDNVNVYTINKDQNLRLAVDARKDIDNSIPVGISGLVGDYNFKIANNNLLEGGIVTLKDKFLNTQTELKTGTTYNFTITNDAASKGEDRFELNFTQKATAIVADAAVTGFTAKVLGNIKHGTITVQIAGSTTPITIKVVDITGKTLTTVNAVNGTNTINIGNTAAGIKLLQISNGTTTIVEKAINQ